MTTLKSVLALVAVQTGATWLQEVEGTVLSKELMTKYGLKGSPKLSKQLLGLGLSPDRVSKLLSGGEKHSSSSLAGCKIWEKESLEVVRLQGNSSHYQSCQRMANPQDPTDWSGATAHCQVKEDVLHYQNGDLIFVTEGELGDFRARVKIRVLKDRHGNPAGLFMDRPYGAKANILEASKMLALEKGLPLYGTSNYWPGKPVELRKLNSPSTNGGYQDSRSWEREAVEVMQDDNVLLKMAYQGRIKEGGCYIQTLKSVGYNSQKGLEFQALPVNRSLLRHALYTFYGVYPKEAFEEVVPGAVCTWDVKGQTLSLEVNHRKATLSWVETGRRVLEYKFKLAKLEVLEEEDDYIKCSPSMELPYSIQEYWETKDGWIASYSSNSELEDLDYDDDGEEYEEEEDYEEEEEPELFLRQWLVVTIPLPEHGFEKAVRLSSRWRYDESSSVN